MAKSSIRAVIVFTRADGSEETPYEGPYAKPATAHGRITVWENRMRDFETGKSSAGGQVEKAVTRWEPWPSKEAAPASTEENA
ncbi:hypothetical protein [Streptomyces sp. NPDC051219]|uniref:hypothetical protein n=1 Tax=Streptomyces sp. NPDC051219 TaxID=3155283 RepID=UPI00343A9A5F